MSDFIALGGWSIFKWQLFDGKARLMNRRGDPPPCSFRRTRLPKVDDEGAASLCASMSSPPVANRVSSERILSLLDLY